MKKYIVILIVLISILFNSLNIKNVIYGIDNKKQIKFDGDNYYFAFSKKDITTKGYFNQYLKEGETPANWSKMIALYNYPSLKDPIKAAKNFKAYYKEKFPDGVINYEEDTNKNEAYIAFVVSNGKTIQFNYFRYVINKKYNGLICYQYFYGKNGNDIKAFDKEVGKNYSRWDKLMKIFDAPKLYEYDYDSMDK